MDTDDLPDTNLNNPKTDGAIVQSPSTPPNVFSGSNAPLPAGLYLVATPIGNLRDITLRALDVLAGADHILCEDTRQSRKLMQAYGLSGKLSAYHDHNAARRVESIVAQLEEGAAIALVSDAGTPIVSDPGHKLARAAIDAGIDVFAVPGASSVLAALVSSGLPSDKFCFAGFLPAKPGARQSALTALRAVPATLIFFESAGRLVASLKDMKTTLGDRQACIARELTKKYEEIFRGSIDDLLQRLGDTKLKGEIVVLVEPSQQSEVWEQGAVDAALRDRVPQSGVKTASAEIADLSGWSKRDVYSRALTLKTQAKSE